MDSAGAARKRGKGQKQLRRKEATAGAVSGDEESARRQDEERHRISTLRSSDVRCFRFERDADDDGAN